MQNSESALKKYYAQQVPETVVGSHDPLLERVLCEGCYPPAMQGGLPAWVGPVPGGRSDLCGRHALDVESG